ncbi:hypothetical protein C7974DRAFT_396002 [Boeremia exigua]|uniref:uncharacterized protein n=1 Tax=Boeremia exigua TaxID=749465 RepID=UPI001E8E1838|nr:uncharacterized protein C7974DRAFT_396002 [Boeremia exigua]KAH6625383.1 hypothetical protein C7974DRAFT_396002 [Boeremia exigua]
MPPSDPQATPEFQYPPVQADSSLTSLDLNTLMMKSTTRRLPEQLDSSLDDSTYEMLTDSLIELSDDEAHTASIASTSDDRTPDDASTFSDDDDDDFEDHHRALDESIPSVHATTTYDDLETPVATSGDDSMITMVPDHLESSGGLRMLQLEEQPTENDEATLGSIVLRAFPTQTQELPKVLEVYGQPQVRLLVKAALSPRYLSTPETYKILFLGSPEKWAQDDIISHIHAALRLSPSNTRSVMVRGQMEPLGTVIDAQRCLQYEIRSAEATGPDVALRMENGQHLRLKRRSKPRFDLAILCHTETATDMQAYDSLRTAFSQHQIPLIELTDIKPYGSGAKTYDTRSLAVCIEGRSDDKAEFELLEVLPLDTYSFCELEPAQVNRHLALISPHLAPPTIGTASKTRLTAVGDTVRAVGKQLRTGAPATTKVLLISIALTAMVSAFVFSPMFMPLVFPKPTEMVAEPMAIPSLSVASPLVTPPAVTSSSSVSISPLSSSSVAGPKGLTVLPSASKRTKPKQSKKEVERLSGFDIQTAGEKQFILTPSKELVTSRKKPQLQIQVFRDATLVPVHYVRTILGEYFVDLEDEYSFGAFNVSIASYSKPLLRQSFAISLGHNKTWFDQMVELSMQKAMSARTVFLETSSSAAEQVQAKLNNVVGPKVSQWIEEGRRLEQAAHSAAKEGLESGAELIKHVPETTWTGLRKATAPVRLSQTMWKARTNALRARCAMETASGRWLKVSEQPSRACSELAQQKVGV